MDFDLLHKLLLPQKYNFQLTLHWFLGILYLVVALRKLEMPVAGGAHAWAPFLFIQSPQ